MMKIIALSIIQTRREGLKKKTRYQNKRQ